MNEDVKTREKGKKVFERTSEMLHLVNLTFMSRDDNINILSVYCLR